MFAIEVHSNRGFGDEQEGWVIWSPRHRDLAVGTSLAATPHRFETKGTAESWIKRQPDALFDRFHLEVVPYPTPTTA